MKGATEKYMTYLELKQCFNPRAREGRDDTVPFGLYRGIVSIHAPVKGATCYFLLTLMRNNVSIHAPVKGATV